MYTNYVKWLKYPGKTVQDKYRTQPIGSFPWSAQLSTKKCQLFFLIVILSRYFSSLLYVMILLILITECVQNDVRLLEGKLHIYIHSMNSSCEDCCHTFVFQNFVSSVHLSVLFFMSMSGPNNHKCTQVFIQCLFQLLTLTSVAQ